MRTSEILDAAADAIETRGWERGGGWNYANRSKEPLCLEGGIMAALGVTKFDLLRQNSRVDWRESLVICPAFVAVREYLGLRPHQDLFDWNDDKGRSKEDVLILLREVAEKERIKEQELVS